MTPESITTDLEHSRRLKEAGWPQNNFLTHEQPDHRPIFAWYSVKPDHDKDMYMEFCEEESNYGYRMYSAPTAEEVLRRLPDMIEDGILRCSRSPAPELLWVVTYANMDGVLPMFDMGKGGNVFCADTLANAASSMWIWLSENKLLTEDAHAYRKLSQRRWRHYVTRTHEDRRRLSPWL